MERYWQIQKINIKHHVPLHLLICIGILGISPLLMGVANLSAEDAAKVLERYVALTGIILIPPVFLPEQDKDIRGVVYAKYTKASSVYLIRLAGNLILLAAFLGIYIGIMKWNHCDFPPGKYFLGTLSEIIFFGGLGLAFYGISDNLVSGYMAPVMYYVVAIGGGYKHLKRLYPFSMSMGSYREKGWLLAAGVLLLAAGIYFRCRRK